MDLRPKAPRRCSGGAVTEPREQRRWLRHRGRLRLASSLALFRRIQTRPLAHASPTHHILKVFVQSFDKCMDELKNSKLVLIGWLVDWWFRGQPEARG